VTNNNAIRFILVTVVLLGACIASRVQGANNGRGERFDRHRDRSCNSADRARRVCRSNRAHDSREYFVNMCRFTCVSVSVSVSVSAGLFGDDDSSSGESMDIDVTINVSVHDMLDQDRYVFLVHSFDRCFSLLSNCFQKSFIPGHQFMKERVLVFGAGISDNGAKLVCLVLLYCVGLRWRSGL